MDNMIFHPKVVTVNIKTYLDILPTTLQLHYIHCTTKRVDPLVVPDDFSFTVGVKESDLTPATYIRIR